MKRTLCSTRIGVNHLKLLWRKLLLLISCGAAILGRDILASEPDSAGPGLLYVGGSPTMTQVKVWFTEPVDPGSAQTAANYALSHGVAVSAAALSSTGGSNVVLTTSPQPEGATLTLTVNHVKDVAGNIIAANSSKEFGTQVWLPGQVLHEFWKSYSGSIGGFLADKRFPLKPTFSTWESMFEFPPGVNTTFAYGSTYGNKLSTWFVPDETADYAFYACSDDASNLYLSTDADPANKKLIAQETGYSLPRTWTSAGTGSAGTKRSDTFAGSKWPPAPGSPIHLEAGKRYYLESVHVQGGGLDNVSATFRNLVDGDPVDGTESRLTGSLIGYYLDPNIEVTFTTQPADQQGIIPSPAQALLTTDFKKDDGGFTVTNTAPEPPGPWKYDLATGRWVAGTADDCAGPYASRLTSPAYTVSQDGAVTLSFDHRYSFEPTYDGGQVRLSLNGGPYRAVAANDWTTNGYSFGVLRGNGTLLNQRAFNGTSPGYDRGEFITSRVLLGTFSKGDMLSVQFLGSWDECATGTNPNWEVASYKLELLPMAIADFGKSDMGFTVASTSPAPPSPWSYVAGDRNWATSINEGSGQGPFATTLTSPDYLVAQTDEVTLNFTHSYWFENDGRDAGQVRISVNGGPFTPVPAEKFTSGGYAPGIVTGSSMLQGQRGFNGMASSFDTSSAVLGTFSQNDKIAVQFVAAWDASVGARQSNWRIQSAQLVFGKLPVAVTFDTRVMASLYGEEHGGLAYQWQRQVGTNFVDIPGQNLTSLRIFPAAADFETAFRLKASVPGKSAYSRAAKLTTGGIAAPTVEITSASGKIWITFTGTLQTAQKVTGPYTEVPGAVSPYPVSNASGVTFFRSVK